MKTEKIEIKHISGTVLFSAEISVSVPEKFRVREALELAVKARANLAGAYLAGANLAGAYLAGANLAGAYLDGAYLAGDEKLIGERPIFQLGPIGSRCEYFVAYITDKGLRLRAGCFFGTRSDFESKLQAEHGDANHAIEYRAALTLIDMHTEIWAPKTTGSEK